MLKQSNQSHFYYNGGRQASRMSGRFGGDSCHPRIGRPFQRNEDEVLSKRITFAKDWYSHKKKHSSRGGAVYSNGVDGVGVSGVGIGGCGRSFRGREIARYQNSNSPTFGDDGYYGTAEFVNGRGGMGQDMEFEFCEDNGDVLEEYIF